MHYNHPKDKADSFSAQALEKIKACDLPLVPGIYEMWYVHFAGSNPELSHAIELIDINEELDFTYEACAELYDKFLNNEEEVANVREAGSQIQTTIKDVNALVNDVKDVTSQYNGTLEDISSKLEGNDYSTDEVKDLLKTIALDTNVILEKNKKLEQELGKQAQVMMGLQRDLDRVRQEAMTDGLTNVANRKAFDIQLNKMIEAHESNAEQTFSLILMDIDHFKSFNDNYGHQIGDQVLRLVAKTLLDGVKGRDFVARYGGEEFALLLPNTNQHAGQRLADELREAVANKQVVNRNSGKKLGRITLSGGITEFYGGDTVDDIIERADNALYEAKNKGRNMICLAKVKIAR
ncbi:MAG: GGDEF domain-containing protein [Alphaproteobacteria bacterium]|nr:GGDEF domain-containing protein [Alphaproteobacteria bacterium]